MSLAKDQHAKKHGTNRNTKEGRYGTRQARAAVLGVSWDEIDPLTIMRFVHAVTEAGDACTFGRTSDKGALSVTILTGQDRLKEYYKDADEAERGLKELTALATS